MQQLGRYEIVAELGRGAMGAVFRARDPRIDRTVAIKTISVVGADEKKMEEYRQRFFREAQAAGRLSHPGIVAIFDVGEDTSGAAGGPFIVMEYVDGRTLNELVEAAPNARLPLEMALDLVQQIAMALDYAQSQQIVHRDIKPANIIVTHDGRAKIADFGIAKISLTEITLPGHVLGTPAYMAPEQLSGKPIDGRSDLFSLGVIAYWLLTGVKPFTGESITEVSIQVATKEPKPPTEVDATLSPDLDYILARALAKDPEQRYQRGKQLSSDLQDVRMGKSPRSLNGGDATVVLATQCLDQTPTSGTTTSQRPVSATPIAASADATRSRKRGSLVVYSLLAAVVMLACVAAFAGRFNPALPADLQIVGRYPFQAAEVFIWVDGDLRYHDELRGAVHPHARHHEPAPGGTIALTLPVRAGTHTVRVRVDAPGEAYDRDTSIPGRFPAYSQKTLQLNFGDKSLGLKWE
jgi:eukaryotic-like serine/threonine-protein kinase